MRLSAQHLTGVKGVGFMDAEFLVELFEPFGPVSVRKMFGEIGVFHRGLSFVAVIDGVVRLKADEETIPDFMAEGMEPWRYQRKDGKVTVMNYWQIPERLFDDPDELAKWAQKAFEVAMRADAVKPLSKRKLTEI